MAKASPRHGGERSWRSLLAALYGNSAVRYLAVGGASFAIDFLLILLGHEFIGLSIPIATAIAFLASFAFTYTLQRFFSFDTESSHGVALTKYIVLVAFNTVATTIVVSVFDSLLGQWALGKVIATSMTTLWNYFIYRYWIFVKSPHAGRSNESHVVIGQVVNDPSHSITQSNRHDV
jgi:putative flippase GtrA